MSKDNGHNLNNENFVECDFEQVFGIQPENNNSTSTSVKVDESDYAKKIRELSDEELIKFLQEGRENDEKRMEYYKATGKRLDKTNRILTWINKYFNWIAFPVIILYLFFVFHK